MNDIKVPNTYSKGSVLTKDNELQLSRLGIYNNVVPFSELCEEVLDRDLKSDFWEFQELFVNEPRVMAIKCNQEKVLFSGSKKRKVKKIITTLKNSSMFYSLHSLKRYRERSCGNEEININDFHSIDDKWINKLFDEGFGSVLSEDKTEGVCRQDILIPFGDGAFLGRVEEQYWSSPNKVDTYTITYRKGNPYYSMPYQISTYFLPSFATRTYIGREDFTWFQEQVFNQYHSNDWDAAIHTMKNNRMKEDHWSFNIRM